MAIVARGNKAADLTLLGDTEHHEAEEQVLTHTIAKADLDGAANTYTYELKANGDKRYVVTCVVWKYTGAARTLQSGTPVVQIATNDSTPQVLSTHTQSGLLDEDSTLQSTIKAVHHGDVEDGGLAQGLQAIVTGSTDGATGDSLVVRVYYNEYDKI